MNRTKSASDAVKQPLEMLKSRQDLSKIPKTCDSIPFQLHSLECFDHVDCGHMYIKHSSVQSTTQM